ncbi:MAG: hypothetical protein LBI31_03035, partial [Zoogloeaceae bacterium]|nr:hypothetical protein [Zoogloeaceae bacterium]
ELREKCFHNRAFDSIDALKINLSRDYATSKPIHTSFAPSPPGIGSLIPFLMQIRIIPLYGGVARSAGVVTCLIYYGNYYNP